ncbi:hypothetical protein BD560DRAFT_399699 [Blakeslea trispora]|nr:hypothetical protein BD560DRAFT_399699 [Blakeslea trispora]
MSCQSCSGCFTNDSCSSPKQSKKENLANGSRFQSLLNMAATSSDGLQKEHDHVIPTIMSTLSKNIYASQVLLFKANDELSLREFLLLADRLYTNHILGFHIAWAAEFCQGDVQQLLKILTENDTSALIQHCNDQAEIHELFSQLPPGSIERIEPV